MSTRCIEPLRFTIRIVRELRFKKSMNESLESRAMMRHASQQAREYQLNQANAAAAQVLYVREARESPDGVCQARWGGMVRRILTDSKQNVFNLQSRESDD